MSFILINENDMGLVSQYCFLGFFLLMDLISDLTQYQLFYV